MEDKEFENKILNTIMVKQQMLINDIFNMINEKYIEKSKIKEIRDKAEVMDYYVLSDVIEDLNKLLGDEE